MKLVDTSSWVHALRRKGNADVRARVQSLLERGEAAWCPMVRLELWNGVGSEDDRASLRSLEHVLLELPMNDAIWQAACDLADRCRRAGRTAPVQDVLIAACAHHHQVELEHCDEHFSWLMTI
jgi:predicted nucleic acid-binding protein